MRPIIKRDRARRKPTDLPRAPTRNIAPAHDELFSLTYLRSTFYTCKSTSLAFGLLGFPAAPPTGRKTKPLERSIEPKAVPASAALLQSEGRTEWHIEGRSSS